MKLLLLLLGLLSTGCSCQRHETSIFGEPLFVNGKRVTDDEIKLALIYGRGRLFVDQFKVELIIEHEIARQVRETAEAEVAELEKNQPFADAKARVAALETATAGLSSLMHAKYRISDQEFDSEYQYNIDDFKKSFPTLDIDVEIRRAFRSVEWYREQVRQTMHFDRVFLPPNPDDWPASTMEAIRSDKSGGELMIPDYKQSYEERTKAAARNDGTLPREDPLLMEFLREMVRNARFSQVAFKTRADGIDGTLALWADADADGRPEVTVTIQKLWDRVQQTVTDTEIDEAKQWFVTSIAIHDRLAEDGALLSVEDGKKALNELTQGFEDNEAQLEQIATSTYSFPSVDAFAEFYVMREGFHRMIEPKLEPGPDDALSPALSEYLERANRAMGLGMVDSQVLLVSAMDIPHFCWKRDGWEWARRKAQGLRAEYDRDPTPKTWSRLMDENSEYWDRPDRVQQPGNYRTDCFDRKQHGRFGPRYRNDLIGFVGENPYTEWVTGECITDHVFFDQAEGTVDGPFRGPLGWYLTSVEKRTPPARPLDMNDPRHRQLLKDDYLHWAFIQYTKEAVAQAKVRGWKPH